MTPSRFRWGIMFVAIGVALLLTNADVLGSDYWWGLLSWWPLILIAVGLEKIFLRSKLHFVSYLAPLLMVAAMVFVGFEAGSDSSDRSIFSSYRWSENLDQSIHTIEAVIDHGENDIRGGRSRFDLVSARFDRFTRKPRIDFSKADGIARLDISRRFAGPGGFIIINSRRLNDDWLLSFSDEASLKLTCNGENADVDLNLHSVPLEELTVENDEGSIFLKAGILRPHVCIKILGEDARFRLRIPQGSGLKVAGNSYAGYLESFGLIENGDYYVSKNYDSSAVQLDLELDDELQNLSIGYY